MKEVPNLQFGVKFTDMPDVTTASLLRLCIARPPQGGFTYSSMRERMRVEKAMDGVENGGIIKLEDADYSVACDCVQNMTWALFHPDLVRFAEQFGK